jgi:AraC-like DNA-binding protein
MASDWTRCIERSVGPLPTLVSLQTIAVGDIWGEKFHSTPSNELLHVLSGTASIQYHRRTIRVGPGDTFVIPQGTQHRDIRSEGETYRVIYTFFRWPSGKKLLETLQPAALIGIPTSARTHIQMLVRQLESEYLGEARGSSERMQLTLMEIILALARHSHAAGPVKKSARETMGKARRKKLAEEVHRYLSLHCSEQISLEDLAQTLDVSPFHLCRTYTQAFGVSMTDTIARLRVERGAELLKTGNVSVKEAALRSGFTDPNYFAKVFRKVTGLSPSHYAGRIKSSN